MDKAIVFDFNRTLFDPDTDGLMPQCMQILSFLHEDNVPLFLVCKGGNDREKKIYDLGLAPYFEKIIVTENKGAEDFMTCLRCHPEKKYFVVGDRLNEEIRYGLACGMTAIWLKKGKFADEIPPDVQPHYTIYSLSELQNALFEAWQ